MRSNVENRDIGSEMKGSESAMRRLNSGSPFIAELVVV